MKRLDKTEQGAIAVEYALICALIALATTAVLLALGTDLYKVFAEIRKAISDI